MIINDDDLVYRAPTVLNNIQDFVNIEKPVNYNQLLRYRYGFFPFRPLTRQHMFVRVWV